MNKFGIGLIGCGTVGSGLIRNLAKANPLLRERLDIHLEIVAAAVKDITKVRDGLPVKPITDWRKVIADPAVQIVVELVGGVADSFQIAQACLQAPRHRQ